MGAAMSTDVNGARLSGLFLTMKFGGQYNLSQETFPHARRKKTPPSVAQAF